MAETEEGGRGEESRGGSGYGKRTSKSKYDDVLNDPAKGRLEQKQPSYPPPLIKSASSTSLPKSIIMRMEQSLARGGNWTQAHGGGVVIKVNRYVYDNSLGQAWSNMGPYFTNPTVDLNYDWVQSILDVTNDALSASALYGTTSESLVSPPSMNPADYEDNFGENHFIYYSNSSLPPQGILRDIQVTWNSGYQKIFNIPVMGTNSIWSRSWSGPDQRWQSDLQVFSCSQYAGSFDHVNVSGIKYRINSLSQMNIFNPLGPYRNFSFHQSVSDPADKFPQGVYNIPLMQPQALGVWGSNWTTRVGMWDRTTTGLQYTGNISLFAEIQGKTPAAANANYYGAYEPGYMGEQEFRVLNLTIPQSTFTQYPGLVPPTTTVIPDNNMAMYSAVQDAMNGQGLFKQQQNYNMWSYSIFWAKDVVVCASCVNCPQYTVCLDPGNAAFWQYSGEDCAGVAIPGAVMANPTNSIFLNGGCCPSCYLSITTTTTAPTTFGGTDGQITITQVNNLGVANFTYVVQPLGNVDAGKGAGVIIGSGAVSNTSFTFGQPNINLAQGGGASGTPVYATSAATCNIPVVGSGGAGTSTQGLEAGYYNIYVFDSTVGGACCRHIYNVYLPPVPQIAGCTDNNASSTMPFQPSGIALNYDANAVVDDNSCIYCDISSGKLVNFESQLVGGTGDILISPPVVHGMETTSAAATDGEIVLNAGVHSGGPGSAFPNILGMINNIVDSSNIQNAEYKMALYKRTSSALSLSGASTVGATVTNVNGTIGAGFNHIWGPSYSISYGYYAIKCWISDPDATIELEECYQVIFFEVPVLVCLLDNTTTDGVVISDPALRVPSNSICQINNNFCCDDPVISIVPIPNSCASTLTAYINCNPSPTDITINLMQLQNGGYYAIDSTTVTSTPNQTSFSHTWLDTNILTAHGNGHYRVTIVSSYAGSPICPKTSDPLLWEQQICDCTDPVALNYNPLATEDCNGIPNDTSCCTYCIYGCTDPAATNYNSLATCDNNSCSFPITGCTDPIATNYNPIATTACAACCLYGPACGCTDPAAQNYGYNLLGNFVGYPPPCDDGSCAYCFNAITLGTITTTVATTTANCLTASDGTATLSSVTLNNGFLYTIVWTQIDGTVVYDDGISYATTAMASYDQFTAGVYIATITDQVGCTTTQTFTIGSSSSTCGCTDPNATNYDASATQDDGSCEYCGCMDPNASNYDPNASCSDNTCVYDIVTNPCIPTNITNLIQLAQICISHNGSSYYNKYISGQSTECSIMNVWKLILVEYLLSRIGLNCIYNCADLNTADVTTAIPTCGDIWTTGGPTTGTNDIAATYTSITTGEGTTITDPINFFVANTSLYNGDAIKMPSGYIYRLTGPSAPATGAIDMLNNNPESYYGSHSGNWIKCNDTMRITNFNDNTNYLDNFSKFITKFCSDCDVSENLPVSPGGPSVPIGPRPTVNPRRDEADIIDDIQINNNFLNI